MGDQSYMVTYCPLCASAMVFEASIDGKDLVFGVSGLLYRSDVLMYDRETQSLWTQLGMRAVSGPSVGTKLKWLASEQMNFGEWKKKYPDGKMLSLDTGFRVDYRTSDLAEYFTSPETIFPVPFTRKELRKKSYICGVVRNGQAMAFHLPMIPAQKLFELEVGAEITKVFYDRKAHHFQFFEKDGTTPIPSVIAFWFAWQAFYPDTKIWKR